MWHGWQVRYEVLTPVHIGHHDLGMIRRARPYVPGRALWGAVTNRLMEALGPSLRGRDLNGAWAAVSEFVKEQMRFSYLFPESAGKPLHPVWSERGVVYGPDEMSEADFRRRFMTAGESTAVDPATWTAQDESLHGTEFLAARERPADPAQGPGDRVILTGYVFVWTGGTLSLPEDGRRTTDGPPHSPTPPLPHSLSGPEPYTATADGLARTDRSVAVTWEEVLAEVQVGGERTYGCGRLRLLGNLVTLNTDIPLFDLWKCADLNNEAGPAVKPVVSPEAGPAVKPVVVPAHLDWREKKGIPPLEGDIEPLLGREYDPQLGPGRKRVKGVLSYAPGVHYHDSCRISHMGVWTVL